MTIWTDAELPVYVNGVLLSRRLISDDTGTAITQASVSSIKLSVYTLGYDDAGNVKRTAVTGFNEVDLTVSDVIYSTVQQDADSVKYNFRYCVENAFVIPNQRYCVEYKLSMADNHTVVIPIYVRTLD